MKPREAFLRPQRQQAQRPQVAHWCRYKSARHIDV